MRFILLAVTLTALCSPIQAQVVEEMPLRCNPVLQRQAREEQASRALLLGRLPVVPALVNGRGTNDFKRTDTIIAGDTLRFGVDTAGLAEKGSLRLAAGTRLNFGNFQPDNFEFRYISNPGTRIGLDTAVVEILRSDNTVFNTLSFLIFVRRANRTIVKPVVAMDPETRKSVCVETDSLPGTLVSSVFTGKFLAYLGKPSKPAGASPCFLYETKRYAGTDTINYQVCDAYKVCDTYRIPFSVRQDTVTLPFIDDFSYTGPYPSARQWLDKDAFVNNSLAFQPPSIGVATFDGLDETGTPYGKPGSSDTLTSIYLDLSAPGGDVYLSFMVQPKGLGDFPAIGDSLVLEFKRPDGSWANAGTFSGMPNNTSTKSTGWSFDTLRVFRVAADYFYRGFQFRFRNYSSGAGNINLWHIDYVQLAKGQPALRFNDIAFTSLPRPILKRYTAMPWNHCRADIVNEVRDSIYINLFNHFDRVETADPSTFSIHETASNTQVAQFTLLELPPIVPVNQRNLQPGRSSFQNKILDNQYIPNLQQPAFNNRDSLVFLTRYAYNQDVENNQNIATYLRNNAVEYTTVCYNYFAYDDGTAEASLGIKNTTDQVAVRFKANVDDTLRAVQIHFPYTFEDISSASFTLYVWTGSLQKAPAYSVILKPYYTDRAFDTLQGFTTYVLTDDKGKNLKPVPIPKGDFYVGWQQGTTSQQFGIGFDKNNDNASQIFSTRNGSWTPVTGINGSLMLRPVVGRKTPPPTVSSTSETTLPEIRLYPNPCAGTLYLQTTGNNTENLRIDIFSVSGHLMQSSPYTETLQLDKLPNGIYFLRITDKTTALALTRKFILQQ